MKAAVESKKKAGVEFHKNDNPFDHPALLYAVRNGRGQIVGFGRTKLGQAAYDVLISSLSAAEAARRHQLDRAFVLKMRRENPKLRQRLQRLRKPRPKP